MPNTTYQTYGAYVRSQVMGSCGDSKSTPAEAYVYKAFSLVTPDGERRRKPKDLISNMTKRSHVAYDMWESGMLGIRYTWPQVPMGCTSVYRIPQSIYQAHLPCAQVPWDVQARNRFKNTQVSIAEDVFEVGKTYDMFRDAVVTVGKAYREYRRYRNSPGKVARDMGRWWRREVRRSPGEDLNRLSKSVAQKYLAYNFGLRPLMETLDKSVQKLVSTPVHRTVMKGGGNSFSTQTLDSGYFRYQVRTDYSLRWKYYVTLRVDASPFTMGNPLELAYNLMPLSWVVDQLIPVGNFLSSLDGCSQVESAIGVVTTRNETYIYGGAVPWKGPGYAAFTEHPFKRHRVNLNRIVVGPPTVGSASVLPTLRPSSMTSGLINDLALLRGMRR